LSDIQARGTDLYLHQQAIDTSTPSGRMLFQMLGVFAEFERAMITSRIKAGHERARSKGVKFGRPTIAPIRLDRVREALNNGGSIRAIAKATGVSTATVQRVKQALNEENTVAA
jgi:DNA invertase Pin-like site-specific DNA recombinase